MRLAYPRTHRIDMSSEHRRRWTLHLPVVIGYEPVHEISNNVVSATSNDSDQPAHTRSLIRAFASRLTILRLLSY